MLQFEKYADAHANENDFPYMKIHVYKSASGGRYYMAVLVDANDNEICVGCPATNSKDAIDLLEREIEAIDV